MNIEERLRDMGRHQPSELPSQNEWDRFRARGHGRLLRRRVGVALAAAVIVVVGAQGASSLLQQQAASLPPAGGDSPSVADWSPGLIAMQTWYARGDLLYLNHQLIPTSKVSETERGPAGADRVALLEATLEWVLRGPSDSSSRTVFPGGTRLIAVDLDRLTTVNLSTFSKGLSAGEQDLALAQIAATVLQLEEVESVTVLEDGNSVTDAPLTEAFYEGLLPPIVITQPAFAEHPQSFAGSLVFEGTANVFEANVLYELVGDDEKVFAEGFTTATCGTGCRGDLSQRVRFKVDEPTLSTLNVYSASAEDGSRMFEVSVPVYLCPAGSEIGDNPYATCGQS
jgi:hypothetical protein